jgi:hypothetical protein
MSDIGSHEEWMNTAKDQSDGCIPRFHVKAVESKARSEVEGRPVFDEVPYVEILIPGDRTSIVDRPLQDADKDRWPQQYARFKENRERVVTGTPLELWPYLNVARVAELRALNIFSVEAIADLSDTGLGKIGPEARELQQRAKAFLQPQSATETDLRTENQELRGQIANLQAQHDEAMRMLDEKTAPKKPGRPKKAA